MRCILFDEGAISSRLMVTTMDLARAPVTPELPSKHLACVDRASVSLTHGVSLLQMMSQVLSKQRRQYLPL